MDFLAVTWIIIDVVLCIGVPLLYRFKNNLPDICGDIITWGKTRGGNKNGDLPWFRKILLIPNRWFIHFYAFGLAWNTYLLFTFYQSCMQDIPSLQGVLTLLPTIKGNSSNSGVDCFSVLFTMSLITIQLTRRLYESLFVASFTGEMHLLHYVVGLVFYGLVNLTVLAEIPTPLQQGWCNSCQRHPNFSLLHLTAVSLFAWANYHQYNCHKILGTLTATTPSGRKVYAIPCGDWFNYVSSPHYLAEIIIYIALFLAMKGLSRRWPLVLLFVISNLHHGATVTHQWYRQKFESYPKDRTILIPYVY